MNNLISILVLLVAVGAHSATPISPVQANKILCQDAVKSFPGSFKNVKDCINQSRFRGSEFEREAQISFPSCETEEMMVLLIDRYTREIQEASTGLDPDICND